MDGIALNKLIPHSLIFILLALAMTRMPYDYYLVMRWVICAALVYLVVNEAQISEWGWVITFAALIGIYRPMDSLGLRREMWVWVNIATIAVLVGHAATLLRRARGAN